MTNKEKENIFSTFKARTERDIMVNNGKTVPFGNENIQIKELEWDNSNKFEDKVAEVVKGFKVMLTEKQIESNLEEIVTKVLSLLREDLVELANIATNGLITVEYIREIKATKNDLMKLVVSAFEVNYGYAKNLIALSNKMK